MLTKRVSTLLLLLSLIAPLGAQESFDPLAGFEEESVSELNESGSIQTQEESNTHLSGRATFKSSYGYKEHSVDGSSYEGINQAQSALYLQLDSKITKNWALRMSANGFYDAFYSLSGQDFNNAVLESYEKQLLIDDLYLEGKLSQSVDLKIGRQIVVWGKSDSIRVTDVINPLDNRLPGMTDIKDLRLSSAMIKLDYYTGAWNISAMIIPESRIFLEPAPRGEFFPVDAVFPIAPDPFMALEQPKSGYEDLDAMQYALAINGIFSLWDASFYAADVLDSRWHIEGNLPNATRSVSKIQMLGSAFNIVSGGWLIKSEFALINNLAYNSTQERKSRVDTLIGFDYMGFKETVLSLEIANRHIFEHEEQMAKRVDGALPDFVQRDEVQTAMRATRSFRNDSLEATLLINMYGHNWEYGGVARASLAFDIKDGVAANIGIIEYLAPYNESRRPLMQAISNNARVFADISYSF